MNHPVMFLDRDNKTKLVMVLFLTFQKSYERKITFSIKSVIIKKQIKQFYLLCTWKKIGEKSHQENLKVTKNTLLNTSGNPECIKHVFQLMCKQLTRGCCVISTSCFVYGFIFKVIREKTLCCKDPIRHLREFLYENNRNYNSYNFGYKFTFIPFLSSRTNQKQKLRFE